MTLNMVQMLPKSLKCQIANYYNYYKITTLTQTCFSISKVRMATFRPTDGADVATGDGIFEPSNIPSDNKY